MASATPEQAKAGMDAWMDWAGKNQAGLVDMGSPLAGGTVVAPDSEKNADETIGGYSIVQGDSIDAAKGMFDGHPHFMPPGGASIEILEFLPMPGM